MWAPCVFRALESADWPSEGIFLPCVELCWTGRREKCRKYDMLESGRGRSFLKQRFVTSSTILCAYVYVCVGAHVYITVTECGWAFTVCARCLGNVVCLFVWALCVFVSASLGNRLSLAKQAASNFCCNLCNPHPLHPSPPPPPPPFSLQERSWESIFCNLGQGWACQHP